MTSMDSNDAQICELITMFFHWYILFICLNVYMKSACSGTNIIFVLCNTIFIVFWYCMMLRFGVVSRSPYSGRHHGMMTSSNGNTLLAFCAGNSPVTGEFPAQRPVTRSFDVFIDLRLNKQFSKQSWGWWFEVPSRSLWRQCNGLINRTQAKPLMLIMASWHQ